MIDPDSRLSQLGLLPVCADEDYFFFESRAYGGDGSASLVRVDDAGGRTRPSRWKPECVACAKAELISTADIAVSFGVGENFEKRVGRSV